MKKYDKFFRSLVIILAVFAFLISPIHAQNPVNRSDFWGKVRYGGGLGLGFGNDSFNAQIAPSAIYQANPFLGIGIGLNFNYAKFGDARFTAYGGSVLGLFNPIPALQLSTEFEQLRVHQDYGNNSLFPGDNYWLPALFVGLGYSSGPVTFGVRYDLLYDRYKSIYADPWMPFVRVYF